MGVLRYLLAVSVLIAHSKSIFGIELVGPVVAVQAFFMISGFYMALILNEKYIGINNSFKLFFSNRFLRLFPTYFLVMIVVAGVNALIFVFFNKSLIINEIIASNLGIVDLLKVIYLNVFLFGQGAILFIDSAIPYQHFVFVPQAWTLELEFCFYLIAPFIVRKSVLFVGVIAVLSLGLRLLFYHLGLSNDPWSYRFFPFELMFFLLGVISYNLYKKIKMIEIRNELMNVIFCIILCYTFMFKFLPGTDIVKSIFYYILLLFSLPFIFKRSIKWKYDRYIGELSFPLYITHIFIISFVNNIIKNPRYIGVMALLITSLVSWCVYYFFEKRIEKYRQSRVITASN